MKHAKDREKHANAHLPLVVFAGEAPLKSSWYNQGIDQAPMIKATGADYHPLHLPERMPIGIRDAFLQARRERRPVVIGIPFDLQERPWTGPEKLPTPSHELLPRVSPMPPHPDDVAKAAQLVAAAERVVVFAGLGAVQATIILTALPISSISCASSIKIRSNP